MHHTKEKGDLGVLKAQVDLVEYGYTVLIPLSEHQPFDLVGYKDGTFKRIQVKYRSIRNGVLSVSMKTSWTDKNGTHEKPVDKQSIDIFCVYCPETNECYYFDPKKINKCINLRVNIPKNNQKKGVYLASDYRRVP